MKTWRLVNQFEDEIFKTLNSVNIKTNYKTITYWHWDREENRRIAGALNKVKGHINKKRNTKCKWHRSDD